jgi:hypothetical protein
MVCTPIFTDPSGAKAQFLFACVFGTTEVVPCYNAGSLGILQMTKVVPCYKAGLLGSCRLMRAEGLRHPISCNYSLGLGPPAEPAALR